MYYLLKSRGARTIYLGANVPFKDVEHVIHLKKPDFAFMYLTGITPRFNFDKFFALLHKQLPSTPFIFSGPPARHFTKKLPPNVQFHHSLVEVTEHLSSL
jgi:hypothetical protein